MKPIIFCGYSNTGKTTLIKKSVQALIKRGYNIGYIKHTKDLTFPVILKDTESIFESGVSSATIFSDKVEIIYKTNTGQRKNTNGDLLREKVRKILQNLSTNTKPDFVILEGFKNYKGPIPKIVFGKSREEIENFKDDFVIAYSGQNLTSGILGNVPYINSDINKEELADFIESHTVDFVADLDCGECGFPTCREFAIQLLAGKKELKDCIPLREDVRLTINGKRVFMKGFVKNTLRDLIQAYVKNLHDTESGTIKITILD